MPFVPCSPTPPWVHALRWVADVLGDRPHHVTGGTAAVLLGVVRDIQDVDVDVDLGDVWPVVRGAAGGDVVSAPAPYTDDQWDIVSAEVRVRGVTIDFTDASTGGVRLRHDASKDFHTVGVDLEAFTVVTVAPPGEAPFDVRVTPLAALTAYKALLRRVVDVFDVRQLAALGEGSTVLPPAGAWVHGAAGEAVVQTHALDGDTFILRVSKTVHYEGNFVYLLLGETRGVLFDSGPCDDREELVDAVRECLAKRRAAGPYPLLVAHTHSHDDHYAGDDVFARLEDSVVVGHSVGDVVACFGMAAWPTGTGSLDLGGRRLEVFATPGHQEAHVMVYDPRWGFLLSGDVVYRGRLYMRDQAAFTASIDRAVAFCDAHPVTWVLGCHIEMGRACEYPTGTTFQPEEPPLELSVDHLRCLQATLKSVGGEPITERLPTCDMVIVPV